MIEALKSAMPLEAVLSDAGVVLRHGKAPCPFHDDRSPSFSVKGNRWTCFAGCGSGDVIDFAARLHGLDTRGAIRLLADRAGLSRQTSTEARAAAQARRERQERERAFKAWEQSQVDYLSSMLRAFRSMKARATTEDQLIALAGAQGVVDEIEYRYEVFCRRDDEAKFGLYQEMVYAGN